MLNEKILKLFKELSSIGFEILKFDCLNKIEYFYGDFELVLSYSFNIEKLMSKETMMQLVETLASCGYGMVNFDFVFKDICKGIKLILYSYTEKTKLEKKKYSDKFMRAFKDTINN
jgi:hypothetical protein